MDAYWKGLMGKAVEWVVHKQKSHQRVGQGATTSETSAYVPPILLPFLSSLNLGVDNLQGFTFLKYVYFNFSNENNTLKNLLTLLCHLAL